MKYKDIITKVVFTIAFALIIYVINEGIKNNVIEDDLADFQNEYKSYIENDEDFKVTSDSSNRQLRKYYDTLRTETYKKFRKEMFDCIYKYNFLKNENTLNFQKEDIEKYQKLIEANDDLINELKKEYSVSKLNSLESNTDEMQGIAIKSLSISTSINNEFNKAQGNNGTALKLDDDCFSKQQITSWEFERDISNKYCSELGLSNCISNSPEENNSTFISYTLNNPKKVNKKYTQNEYVSYLNNDYRKDNGLFKSLQQNNNINVEVFSKEVAGRKIYKYNIISIPKTYKLSCTLPK